MCSQEIGLLKGFRQLVCLGWNRCGSGYTCALYTYRYWKMNATLMQTLLLHLLLQIDICAHYMGIFLTCGFRLQSHYLNKRCRSEYCPPVNFVPLQ